MEDTSYNIIQRPGISLFKDRGSKFHGYAFHVKDEQAVQDRLADVKKEHHSARHHCYAYRIGEQAELYRSNDDGEPSHSAGDPILRELTSRELSYVLVVVVRYFGGTKLGVGGLIQAYGQAAASALDESGSKEVDRTKKVQVDFAYAQMSEVMRVLNRHDLAMDEHEFAIKCRLSCSVPLRIVAEVMEELENIPFINVRVDGELLS